MILPLIIIFNFLTPLIMQPPLCCNKDIDYSIATIHGAFWVEKSGAKSFMPCKRVFFDTSPSVDGQPAQ